MKEGGPAMIIHRLYIHLYTSQRITQPTLLTAFRQHKITLLLRHISCTIAVFSRGYSDFTSPSSCVNLHCIDLFVQLHDEMEGMGCGRSQEIAVQDRYPTLAIQTQSKPRDDTTPPRCTRPFQAFRYPQLAPQVKRWFLARVS